MKIPKGMGYYIKYLNNILKCMDTSMIDGYSKKELSDSSSLIDIMSVASDIDDLSFLESIFTAGSDTSLFFNSFDFMKDSLYSSNKERIENSIRDTELRNKIVSRCGDLLNDDIEIVDLDGGYDVSSFDDDDGVSIVALEDSESFKGTVDSVSKSMEFSFDDEEDEDVFDEEYEDDDSSIYDVDDSEFDEDEDYVDVEDSVDSKDLEDSEDSLASIYDAAFSDDYEDDDETDDEEDFVETEDVSDANSVYDSAFDNLGDEEDDADSFSIDDSFFDSLSIEESTGEDEDSDDLSVGESIEESNSSIFDFDEDDIISGEKDDTDFSKSENIDSHGEMINTFVDNEPKQVDDDLFSLEPEKQVLKKSLNFVDNSSAKQDESFDFSSFDAFEDDDSSELFPEDVFEEDRDSEVFSETSDFESLVSDNIEDSGFEGDSFSDTDYEQGSSDFVDSPVQKTFDDSLAEGIVKFAELFNKDRRSQMARKMKSFIEDHKVTAEDEEEN